MDDMMLDAMVEELRDYDDEVEMQELAEFLRGDLDCDDYYENWDNLEMGFDPYMGCYSDDC